MIYSICSLFTAIGIGIIGATIISILVALFLCFKNSIWEEYIEYRNSKKTDIYAVALPYKEIIKDYEKYPTRFKWNDYYLNYSEALIGPVIHIYVKTFIGQKKLERYFKRAAEKKEKERIASTQRYTANLYNQKREKF